MQPTLIWLNGKRTTTSITAPLHAPYDQKLLAQVAQADSSHIESAISATVASFPELKSRPSYQRADACRKVRDGLIIRAEEFAQTIANEAGKPIKTARSEVQRAIATFSLAAEEATRITGEQLPVDIDPRAAGYWAIVERFPIGPCSFITPFNFPLNLVAHKVAPALACGCPFIVKPSERTPLTALLLGELLEQANLPQGSWHILPCDRHIARPLVTDDRLKLLSFTGSPEVGFQMKTDAGKKKVILELGNNSAVILEPETNLAHAVARIIPAAFGYAGQSCISVQRIYLHEQIAKEATAQLLAATQKLIVGDPLDEKTDVGPMIDEPAAKRLEQWINESGGGVLCGNKRQGSLFHPTLIQNPYPTSHLSKDEAFGPVAILETYSDFNEVLTRVNNTRYGLQAGLFSTNIHKIRQAFTTLDIGGLIINDVPTTRIDNMPYGGLKDSGLGREGPKYAIQEMTEPHLLLIRSSEHKL